MDIVLKTFLLSCPPQTPQIIIHVIDDRLAAEVYLMRSSISTLLKESLGTLTFPHKMLLNFPLIAECQNIPKPNNREALLNNTLLKSNQQCIDYDYSVGQQGLKYENTIKGKFAIKTSGPFEIVCIHMNGTVTIQL